ncbi:MAG: 16S rRNA (cytosine(1402)-N(4))-methyltransferase RsmH [Dehalococcoidia bacterium]|nr:16S rRNA (cytosine(1402)-N(4))-methyltransferase RsmH [Dehalococcoidia bacterium]
MPQIAYKTVTAIQPLHTSVLLHEAVGALVRAPGGSYIDATAGAGGHSAAILAAAGPTARLLALDADPFALSLTEARLGDVASQVTLREVNFRRLDEVADSAGFHHVDGILMDLGISSLQLDVEDRGFSFRDTGPLDMSFSPSQELNAATIVNEWSEGDIADTIYRYGEEPGSRRIARAIVAARPITSPVVLADVVQRALGGRRGKTHPATRTFQALRIAVNDELAALEATLPQAMGLLRPGGRLAVITFHSLEDRMVKDYFDTESRDCVCPPGLPICMCGHTASLIKVTRRAVPPNPEEQRQNPRSRSAKLRVAERR